MNFAGLRNRRSQCEKSISPAEMAGGRRGDVLTRPSAQAEARRGKQRGLKRRRTSLVGKLFWSAHTCRRHRCPAFADNVAPDARWIAKSIVAPSGRARSCGRRRPTPSKNDSVPVEHAVEEPPGCVTCRRRSSRPPCSERESHLRQLRQALGGSWDSGHGAPAVLNRRRAGHKNFGCAPAREDALSVTTCDALPAREAAPLEDAVKSSTGFAHYGTERRCKTRPEAAHKTELVICCA